MKTIYIIGSLRNPQIPLVGDALRNAGYDAFDEWFSAGPEADDYWQQYEHGRGHTYAQALQSYHAEDVFLFDKKHLDRSVGGVLVMPGGKSAHLELGYLIGCGKPGFILFDKDPERFDIMTRFAKGVAYSVEELLIMLDKEFKDAKGIRTAA